MSGAKKDGSSDYCTEELRRLLSTVTVYSVFRDTGMSLSVVQRFKSNVSSPTIRTVQRFADYFGVDVVIKGRRNET